MTYLERKVKFTGVLYKETHMYNHCTYLLLTPENFKPNKNKILYFNVLIELTVVGVA